ncbi:unnamed protein product, partial [Oppiella nova]
MRWILLAVIIQVFVTCVRASDKVFWYESAAADGMQEAAPIGNGRIGGLVYGHPEVSEFWDEQLKVVTNGTKEQLGKLVVFKGWSPEHGPHEDGVSYNQEIVWDLYTNYVKAADILGVDKEFRDRIAGQRDKLLWPGIGSFGQVMEWMEEQPGEKDDHHRHTSHLFGVYPGHQFNWETSPTLANASLVSLKARGIDPSSDVREWSFAWRSGIYARLRDADNAYLLLRELLKERNTCPNMFGFLPEMQIDGNFGITAAVAEMLVQSHAELIELLPALPAEWKVGHAKGLRARGGHELDIYWENHTLNNVLIKSVVAGEVKVNTSSDESPEVVLNNCNTSEDMRDIQTLLELYNRVDGIHELTDQEIQCLVETKHIPAYQLESILGDAGRGAAIRRRVIEKLSHKQK